jgi:hypothetical protein
MFARVKEGRDDHQEWRGQIVIKINAEVFQEEQDRLLVFAQPIQQIAGGALFAAQPCAQLV